MKRILVSIFVGLSIFLVARLFNTNPIRKEKARTEKIIVGTVAGYAPWVSVNERGEYEGFDIDVAREIAKEMNRELILKDCGSMAPLLLSLEQGTIDIALWGLSITQERLKKMTMIRYQGEETRSYPLIFWDSIPENVTTIAHMAGTVVCVEPGSSQEEVLRKYDFIRMKSTERIDDALLNIQYGKATAAFVEPTIARKFQRKYPSIKILDVPLAPEDQVHGVGIAIRNDRKALIDDVQNAVDSIRSRGDIKQLEQKWEIQ